MLLQAKDWLLLKAQEQIAHHTAGPHVVLRAGLPSDSCCLRQNWQRGERSNASSPRAVLVLLLRAPARR